ncbi:MAG: metalloregulator ArsR/SmtB family transcription factor [Candidatus Thermoplasmatota archaeon]
MPEKHIGVSARQIKILSEPSRLRILSMLFEQENSISGLAKALGLTPATVHHHIKVLRRARLIRHTRTELRGNVVEKYYAMPAKGIDSSQVWSELKDADKVAYRLAILGMLKGMINEAMMTVQAHGTVEWEVGRLHFYRVPYRRDAIQQVEEILEDARDKLARLEAKHGAEAQPGERVTVVITTLP